VRFVIADTFNRSLDKLDGQSQNLIKQTAFDMQRDPENPGLKLHRLERARDKRFWSARVSSDLRLIIHQQPNVFMLCYAGHHDDAYDWAENRKLDVHPDTGAPLFVEVEERIEEVVRTVVREESVKPPLFAEFDPAYLRRLGVPPQWLDALKYVTRQYR
jgi:mRNA-degrading endonuclease RelE of RelBE toxin-antitoxin system